MVMRRAKLTQYFLVGGLLVAGTLTGVLHLSALIFLLVAWIVILLISKVADYYAQR